jgi:hypothetical protein
MDDITDDFRKKLAELERDQPEPIKKMIRASMKLAIETFKRVMDRITEDRPGRPERP